MPTLRSLVNTIGGAIYPSWGGSGWPWSTVVVPGARYDYEADAGHLWANSVVAIAIKWLGDRFPRPRMQVSRVLRSGEWKPVPNHPVELLWKKPNPFYTRRAMEKAIGLSLLTDGNAYIQKVRNGRNGVAELWWLPSGYVRPYWDAGEFITGYSVIVPGQPKKDLPRSEIIHIRDGMDPLNPRLGLSALKAQLREVSAVNEEGSYTPSLLRNSGVPGLVLVPDDPSLRPKKEDAEAIKDRVNAATRGEKRGSTVVLAGKYKVESIGFSPEQLALDKIVQLPMAKIAGACGVALMAMGLPDPGKTYSNLGEANKSSWGTVCSIQEQIGEQVTADLLPDLGFDPLAFAVGYDYSDVDELQESLDARHKRTRDDFLGNIITQNEARDAIGMEPDPEGDRYYFEIQTGVAEAQNPPVQVEGAVNAQPPAVDEPSPNGNGDGAKLWRY